jgi:hypothetical protein
MRILLALFVLTNVARADCVPCESYDVCIPLNETDNRAYAACIDRLNECNACGKPRVEPATPAHLSSMAWLYTEMTVGIAVRNDETGVHVPLGVGLQLELLFGQRSWRGTRIPFRLGPFAAGTLLDGAPGGGQLAAGLTALVWGKEMLAVFVSGGVVLDLPSGAPDRVGGLVRVAFGLTTSGGDLWKPLSARLFLEGHLFPGRDGERDRQEIILGLSFQPLTGLFLLIPKDWDPSR